MKVLLLDNYDSFTFNLQHYLEQLVDTVDVFRNDEIELQDVNDYSHIVISPGPGLPSESGITPSIIQEYYSYKPILGICLGFQALGEFFGGMLYNQEMVAHGIKRPIFKTKADSWLLKDLPNEFEVGLYHSWAVDTKSMSTDIEVSCINKEKTSMSLEHKHLPIAGVQFHPESIMSKYGLKILENWLEYSKRI